MRQTQSVTEAAHLLNDFAGVTLVSSTRTEISYGPEGKMFMMVNFSTNTNCESMAYVSFQPEEYSALNT